MSTQKEILIPLQVSGGEIKLGKNHAIAAYSDEKIRWSCDECLFAVQFPPGTPFRIVNMGHESTMEMPAEAIECLPYKYTIAAFDETIKKVAILDPVLVRIPPKG